MGLIICQCLYQIFYLYHCTLISSVFITDVSYGYYNIQVPPLVGLIKAGYLLLGQYYAGVYIRMPSHSFLAFPSIIVLQMNYSFIKKVSYSVFQLHITLHLHFLTHAYL